MLCSLCKSTSTDVRYGVVSCPTCDGYGHPAASTANETDSTPPAGTSVVAAYAASAAVLITPDVPTVIGSYPVTDQQAKLITVLVRARAVRRDIGAEILANLDNYSEEQADRIIVALLALPPRGL